MHSRPLTISRSVRKGSNIVLIQFDPCASLQSPWKHHRTVANPDQSADSVTNGLHHPAHFPIPAFRDGYAVPAIRTFTATVFNCAELRQSILKVYTVEKTLFLIVAQSPQYADCILAFQTKTRVHQTVRQLTRTGQKQQTFSVQIESADRLPLALIETRQFPENGWSVLGIIMSDHLSNWFVIRNDPHRRRGDANLDRLSIDFDLIPELNPLSNVSRLVIDGNSPFQDHLFHLKPRAQPGLRQNFVQFGAIGLWCEDALPNHHVAPVNLGIEAPGNYIVKGGWKRSVQALRGIGRAFASIRPAAPALFSGG